MPVPAAAVTSTVLPANRPWAGTYGGRRARRILGSGGVGGGRCRQRADGHVDEVGDELVVVEGRRPRPGASSTRARNLRTSDRPCKAARDRPRYRDRHADRPLRLQPFLDTTGAAPPPRPSLSVTERQATAHAGHRTDLPLVRRPRSRPAATVDHRVPVDGGRSPFGCTRPTGPAPPPRIVYFHGGAFWLGPLDHSTPTPGHECARASSRGGVGRLPLAPSIPFPIPPGTPTAHSSGWSSTRRDWRSIRPRLRRPRQRRSEPDRGGRLMAHDRGGPPLRVPGDRDPGHRPHHRANRRSSRPHRVMLTKESMSESVDYYLGTDSTKAPVHVTVARRRSRRSAAHPGDDGRVRPLRDEGEAYPRRLQEAGVPSTARRWDGRPTARRTWPR